MNSTGLAIKRGVKLGAKQFALGFQRPSRKNGTNPSTLHRSRILTYHSVGFRDHEMNVTPDEFRRQMDWLIETKKLLSVSQAAQGEAGIAITFDDGFRDNLYNAATILKKLNIPATVYVVAGRAGGMLTPARHPEKEILMTFDEIRTLESLGVEIGAHSCTHCRLSRLTEDQQREEILGSCSLLRAELGHPVDGFAYPYGSSLDFNDTSRKLARESGCKYAVSNRYGVNVQGADPFALRRITVDASDNMDLFRAKVDGRLDALAWLDSELGIRARRAMNRLLRT